MTLSGLVKYADGNIAPGATLTFTNSILNTEVISTSSNSQGDYSVVLKNDTLYDVQISISGRDECTITSTLQTNSDMTQDYTLNCNSQSGEGNNICTDCWTYQFSDPENQCGNVNVILSNPCTDGTCADPIYNYDNTSVVICGPSTCGNGVIENEEQCDPPNIPTCQSQGFIAGQTYCSGSCQLDTSNCLNCPVDPEGCDQYEFCGGTCEICTGTDFCQAASTCT